jgi:hypothetical protein
VKRRFEAKDHGQATWLALTARRDQRTWRALTARRDQLRLLGQSGMTTAEYAVGTLAACAFAATLLAVVRSGAIKSALSQIIASALSIAS